MTSAKYTKISHVDMDCFGCGSENQHGLKMSFETNGEKIRSIVMVPDYLRGWSNIVHGGILSTICDEIMAWAAIYFTRQLILTKTINIAFLKPVTTGSRLEAIGYVKEQTRKTSAVMTGEIYDEQGRLCVTSTGVFSLFTPDAFKKLKIVPDDLVDRMIYMFAGKTPDS